MDIQRKLASLVYITDIQPIEGADNIELALVKGWQVVVRKNQFQIDDEAVYFEIDSMLPICEDYEFLRKSSYKKMSDGSEGFRLKTIKLRGQYSQGLLDNYNPKKHGVFEEGRDLTETLGVFKYEPPIPAERAGKVAGNFPTGIVPKTDETRIQNLVSEYENLQNRTYYVTEKLDGTSVTYFFKDGKFGVCSRNWELLEEEGNTLWKVARELKIEEILAALPSNFAIQGELIGEGIQKNSYKMRGQTIRFFNAYNIDTKKRLNPKEFEKFFSQVGLQTVPIVGTVPGLPSISDLITYADGQSILNPATQREGIVYRDVTNGDISFKVISNKWLLKNED